MNIITQLIGWASIAHLVTDFIYYLDIKIPQKPFQCNLCMGWWISLFPLVYQYSADGFLYAAITGVLSELIWRIINRL